MKTILTIVCLIIASALMQQADCDELTQSQSLYYKGNMHYRDSNFQSAIHQYEKILNLGFENGALYYNLGNAYFKNGFLGKAILNYLKAKKFIPNDADLISNLHYAQSLIKEPALTIEEPWFKKLYISLVNPFSLNLITLICEILYFILSTLIIVFILTKSWKKIINHLIYSILILFIISLSLLYTRYNTTIIQKQAVIISKTIDSKFEPFNDATTFFTLHEGEHVNVVISKKDWVKIKRSDGKQGWIKKISLELL